MCEGTNKYIRSSNCAADVAALNTAIPGGNYYCGGVGTRYLRSNDCGNAVSLLNANAPGGLSPAPTPGPSTGMQRIFCSSLLANSMHASPRCCGGNRVNLTMKHTKSPKLRVCVFVRMCTCMHAWHRSFRRQVHNIQHQICSPALGVLCCVYVCAVCVCICVCPS